MTEVGDDDSDVWFNEEYSFDTDSDEGDSVSSEKDGAIVIYETACRRCSTQCIKQVKDQINRKRVNLENHSLGENDIKALCISLVGNVTVTDLNLSGNNIGSREASWIAQVISENQYISRLNLADNHISGEGMKCLASILRKNRRISLLNLAGNSMVEGDAVYIATVIKFNSAIKELYLSHNEFRESGGEILGPALGENKTIEKLDLSWNHLRMKGAVAIAKCLQFNVGLRSLNLAWNGFWVEGCQQFQISLEKNRTLRELDLSANRIEAKALAYLIKGVCKNSTLRTLRLGGNPIHCELATKILREYESAPNCGLRTLDITNVSIEDDFQTLLSKIQKSRPLTVVHGTVVNICRRGLIRQMSVFDMPTDPLLVLFEYMKQSNLRLVDFFHVLDKDSSETVSKAEFRQVLKRVNIPMTERALTALMKRLDANNDGQVDFGEFVMGHRDNLRKLSVITEDPLRVEEIGKLKVKVKSFLEHRKGSKSKSSVSSGQSLLHSTATISKEPTVSKTNESNVREQWRLI